MGTLKPGATYIYERVDNVVYAREAGTQERIEVGRDYNPQGLMQDDLLWSEIRRMAPTNPTLQAALDECIMIYKLSKEYNDV